MINHCYKKTKKCNEFLNFTNAQEKSKDYWKKGTFNYLGIFKKIRELWDENDFDEEIENELKRNVQTLYYALKEREPPSDEVIQLFFTSGLFVEMFSSMKTTNYKYSILGIICFILKKNPEGISILTKQQLSESFNTFLFSEGTNEQMQICAPYYASIYLKCMAKLNRDPFTFFFSPLKDELNYFQISCQIIEKCLDQERDNLLDVIHLDKLTLDYIRKTETKIYSLFSYLIKIIFLNNQNDENEEFPEIQQIFMYIIKAFELNLDSLYFKLLLYLDRIWNYSYSFLQNYIIDESIYLPVSQIINEQHPIEAQQSAMILIYNLLDKNSNISTEIDSEMVFKTAQDFFGSMMGSSIYEKNTINAILLLGKKFLIDDAISISVEDDMDDLIGLIGCLIDGLDYSAKNAATFLVFIIIKISRLQYFQDQQFKMDIIKRAFEVALSLDFHFLEYAIQVAYIIYEMINNGNQYAIYLVDSLNELISSMYESNENEEFSDRIDYLFNNYVKSQ